MTTLTTDDRGALWHLARSLQVEAWNDQSDGDSASAQIKWCISRDILEILLPEDYLN